MKFYTVSDTLTEEENQFEGEIAEFVSKKMDPVKFKGLRVAHGVYEQRQRVRRQRH